MKVGLLSGLSALAVTAVTVEALALTVSPEFKLWSYPHLTQLNQSQAFETLSLAGGRSRLPVSAYKVAKVHFITNDGAQIFSGGVEFEDLSDKSCIKEGYKMTSCPNGVRADICPYNSSYFKDCCPKDYDSVACTYPLTRSKDSCGGKYLCYCDPELFPITSCTAPQVTPSPLSDRGKTCSSGGVTRYAECVCPASYSEVCIGINQQGKGTGCTKNGTTKYTACECKPGYTLTCSDLGPSSLSDYCQMNGIKYYKECKTCPNKCSLASCPAGVVCEYEECSKKYCDIGCAVGYRDLDNYWCNGALRCLVGR